MKKQELVVHRSKRVRLEMKYHKDPDPDYPEPDSNWPFTTDGYED